MTVEEIKAKHQPRQLENQVEFDAIMSDINQQQGELNRPLIDRKMEIVKQRELLNIQKQAINQQLSALSAEYQDMENTMTYAEYKALMEKEKSANKKESKRI